MAKHRRYCQFGIPKLAGNASEGMAQSVCRDILPAQPLANPSKHSVRRYKIRLPAI
nr:hypothetical protein [Blastomonas sp. UPD001]